MTAKLFILGRPGSGKSVAARRIVARAENQKFSTVHLNDYQILFDMFKADIYQRHFRPTRYANGFDVYDFKVMDTALSALEAKAKEYIRRVELIIIEFARDDYRKALKHFSAEFMQSAYFLFIDTDADVCIQRIYERTSHPKTSDDYYVSDTIIREYYGYDNRAYMVTGFKPEYMVPSERLWIVDNMKSLEEFERQVNRIAEKMLRLKTRILPETDPLHPATMPLREREKLL